MCGIVAVLADHVTRPLPRPDDVLAKLDTALVHLSGSGVPAVTDLEAAVAALTSVETLLQGVPGVRALASDADLHAAVAGRSSFVDERISRIERLLDVDAAGTDSLEHIQALVVDLKDRAWAIRKDRLRRAAAVSDLAGPGTTPSGLYAFTCIDIALSGIDRLEIRGRDSAGIHVLVTGHGLPLNDPELRRVVEQRQDPLFGSGAVRTPDGAISFVYKVAAEIGELGDNTARLRDAVRSDALLHRAVSAPDALVTVIGHTRWASVGLISEPNAHPLIHEEDGLATGPYVAAALNGDIDNHARLREEEGLRIPAEVTTDAKLIPTITSRRLADGLTPLEAFRQTVEQLEGSVAIAANTAADPACVLLALRGSGQALYVGLAGDAYIVASEPYGLVEETSRYLRMDGATPGPGGVNGQVISLSRRGAGTLDGVRRMSYDGTELPVSPDEIRTAQITTRDIDRAGAPHFLLKEISESPTSVRKTLRGRITERDGRLEATLPLDVLPDKIRTRLGAGKIRRVIVCGQGTAAVAGQGVAAALNEALESSPITAVCMPATELSGFGMSDDMADTLVVAISQSGTTADTNRTVDLVRAHGACVVSIVNRRNSDLVERSHGVLYTSDGRDEEIAVPSTKAFYAQIAAGTLLAVGIADAAGCLDRRHAHRLLSGLQELPAAMQRVLERRAHIAAVASELAPPRRYWAVVGNGLNRIAAQELRIKLSELCYKSISCDATEDKKHIDLACEPLIVVCAAGLDASTADDVAKETAIFRAHRAAPVVIATEGGVLADGGAHTIEVPDVHPSLGYVLTAMAGHLFGYEAAVAIDAQALPLREARAAVEGAVSTTAGAEGMLPRLAPLLRKPATRFLTELREGRYNGHLEANTAVSLSSLLRYGTGSASLDQYEIEFGRLGSPSTLLEDLIAALTKGIDELTRPIDAIKHQAKTVTVGISRTEDAYLKARLVQETLGAGAPMEVLGYRVLRTLAVLDEAVADVTGFTRYRVEGDVANGATAQVVERGGVARDIGSRTDRDPRLRGTKHRAAYEREVTVTQGRSDARTVIIVPETQDGTVTGITLLHVHFHDRIPAAAAERVLEGYRGRLTALVDAVMETETTFHQELLGEMPIVDLLVEPVYVLADRWREA